MAMAEEAIQRAYLDWQAAKFWTFLLKDTSTAPTMTVKTVDVVGGTDYLEPSVAGGANHVNVGQTFIAGGMGGENNHYPAATTVVTITSYSRDATGNITKIYTSPAPTAQNPNNSHTVTLSADIPIKSGTADYNLPADFNSSYTLRHIEGSKDWLKYIEQRYWDRITSDQTINGQAEAYTTYNPISELTQNYGEKRLRLFRTPDSDGLLRLRYFRKFDTAKATIDIPDEYLYKFLDHARAMLIEVKRAADDPSGFMASARASFEDAKANDEAPNDDDDSDARLKSPYESGEYRGPIVNNGQFDPYPY
jgi:hypothetical protein